MKKATFAIVMSTVLVFSSTSVGPITAAQAKSAKVIIAPTSGKKYHKKKTCRGLRKARYTKKISKSKAKKLGYKKCKICYR